MKYEKFAPLVVVGLVGLAALPFAMNGCNPKPVAENAPVPVTASIKPEVALFELPTPTGEKIALKELLANNKAVLLNFWFHG